MTGPSTMAHHKELHERIAELRGQRDLAVARVRELEAELARAHSWLDYEKSQRSKAEAEVERLKPVEWLSDYEWQGYRIKTGRWLIRRVNPSGDTLGGGGRESGADRKMKPSGDGVTPSRDVGPSGSKEPLSTGSAAAEPAACPLCGKENRHLDLRDGHSWNPVARKERD